MAALKDSLSVSGDLPACMARGALSGSVMPDVRQLAAHDPMFAQLIDAGVTDDLNQALIEIATDRAELTTAR